MGLPPLPSTKTEDSSVPFLLNGRAGNLVEEFPDSIAVTPKVTSSADGSADGEEAEGVTDVDLFIAELPPWLFSFATHLTILIITGLIFFPGLRKDLVQFEGVFSDRIGEQLDSDILELSTLEETEVPEPIFVPDAPTMVDDPLASMPDLPEPIDSGILSSDLLAPNVGLALRGRETGMKEALLNAYGGTAQTDAAVQAALEWLKRQQKRTGSWSLVGPYADGASDENISAATAMALLAFQGDGHSHVRGKHQAVVERGMAALLKQQHASGSFYRGDIRNHRPYTQAMATIAVCELFAMTRDESLRKPAQSAVDYAVKIQDPQQGGWRYDPRQESDTSVTGWYLMALQSARMGGLEVPSVAFDNVAKYLDLAATHNGARYGYLPNTFESPAMSAEGLLCRQFLGWRREDKRMQRGVAYIVANPLKWSNADRNTYYWYYATQVLHNIEGYPWEQWNERMVKTFPKHQERIGSDAGSWSPDGDRWGMYGGRLFITCLSTYMLEVYYRHLPIYSPLYRDPTQKDAPTGPAGGPLLKDETATDEQARRNAGVLSVSRRR